MLTRSKSGFDQPFVLRRGRVRRFAGCGWRVAAADVNRDGRSDVIVTCRYDHVAASTAVGRLWRQGTVAVFRRNPANTGFSAPLLLAHPRPQQYMECGRSLAVGDVDGDRRADVVWGCYQARSIVLSLARDSGFRRGTVLSPPIRSPKREPCGESVALGDLGGDSRVDVGVGCSEPVVAAQPAGSALVFRRLAGGRFAPPVRLPSGARRPQAPAVALSQRPAPPSCSAAQRRTDGRSGRARSGYRSAREANHSAAQVVSAPSSRVEEPHVINFQEERLCGIDA